MSLRKGGPFPQSDTNNHHPHSTQKNETSKGAATRLISPTCCRQNLFCFVCLLIVTSILQSELSPTAYKQIEIAPEVNLAVKGSLSDQKGATDTTEAIVATTGATSAARTAQADSIPDRSMKAEETEPDAIGTQLIKPPSESESDLPDAQHAPIGEAMRTEPTQPDAIATPHINVPNESESDPDDQPAPIEKTNDIDVKSKKHYLDIVSVGSVTRRHVDAQRETFGSHEAVRDFYPIKEHNDSDATCFSDVNVTEVLDVCHRNTTYRKPDGDQFHFFAPRQWLLYKKNPNGWLCAQKRVIDGLNLVLLTGKYEIPDYLLIIDDDAWLDLDAVLPNVLEKYPPHEHHVVAGCLWRTGPEEMFTFPWGGFGALLTRAVLERLLTPLHCDDKNNTIDSHHDLSDFANNEEFVKYACQRISVSLIGERHFFKPGMSLMELICQHSIQQPFTKASQWHPTATFCMHSDNSLAYYLQYYHVGRHVGDTSYEYQDLRKYPLDRIAAYKDSVHVRNKLSRRDQFRITGECSNINDKKCPEGSHICHYVTPQFMETRYKALLAARQGNSTVEADPDLAF